MNRIINLISAMVQNIVIENGSQMLKAGFAGDDVPRTIIPSVVLKNSESENQYYSSKGQSKSGTTTLKYPIERGIITNWDDMETLWHQLFNDELKVDSREHSVLLTEVPSNPRKNKEKTSQIMFETFNTPSLYIPIQSVLSLYGSGRTTGAVLDIGHDVTHVVPIYEGYALTKQIYQADYGGHHVTDYLNKLFTKRGYSFTTTAELEIVSGIKESLCYVAYDFDKVMDSNITERSYKLPDGQMITVGHEQIMCAESLFQPRLFESSFPGIHECTYQSISGCNDAKGDMWQNIVLSGGSTMFPGIADRIQKQIAEVLPESANGKVIANAERKYLSWIGGSILASLSKFDAMLITKAEYEEFGPSIATIKCL